MTFSPDSIVQTTVLTWPFADAFSLARNRDCSELSGGRQTPSPPSPSALPMPQLSTDTSPFTASEVTSSYAPVLSPTVHDFDLDPVSVTPCRAPVLSLAEASSATAASSKPRRWVFPSCRRTQSHLQARCCERLQNCRVC